MKNKRMMPNQEKTIKRANLMKEMELLECIEPQNLSEPVGMENGNTKTGECGKVYDKIFVWNLPPVITCPGLSEWCKFNCYNADNRYDKFPIDKWCENLWWVLNKKEVLSNKIQLQLNEYRSQKVAVRIHSSGDFFSKEYIEFWKKIIEKNPRVDFWAYTRSWCVEELEKSIIDLNQLDNMCLIFSCDKTMKKPLEGFPKSIVVNSSKEMLELSNMKKGIICPEQYNLISGCADCGICIRNLSRDIYFILH